MSPWKHVRARSARARSQELTPAEQLLDTLYAALEPLLTLGDPLASEAVISQALGVTAQRGAGREIWDEVVDLAARRARRTDVAVLALVGGLAWPGDLRVRAARLAADLAADGAAVPAWLPALTPTRAGRCWVMSDVFGDQVNVVLEFLRGPAEDHALVFLVDAGGAHALVRDMFLTDSPLTTVARMGEYCARSEGLMHTGAVDPHQWLDLLAQGLAGPWPQGVSAGSSFDDTWALALARLADAGYPVSALAAPAAPQLPDAGPWVAQFLASPAGAHLTGQHGAQASRWAAALYEVCAAVMGEAPDHVSPVSLDVVLPRLAATPVWEAGVDGPAGGSDAVSLGCVARAWVEWACTAEQYPPAAREVLVDVLAENLAALGVGTCAAAGATIVSPDKPATQPKQPPKKRTKPGRAA